MREEQKKDGRITRRSGTKMFRRTPDSEPVGSERIRAFDEKTTDKPRSRREDDGGDRYARRQQETYKNPGEDNRDREGYRDDRGYREDDRDYRRDYRDDDRYEGRRYRSEEDYRDDGYNRSRYRDERQYRDDRYERRDNREERDYRREYREDRDDRRAPRADPGNRAHDTGKERDAASNGAKQSNSGRRQVRQANAPQGDPTLFVHQIVPYAMFWIALFAAVSFILRDLCNLGGANGSFGNWFADLLCGLFGVSAYLLPLFLIVIALRWKQFVKSGILGQKLLLSGSFLLLLSGTIHVFQDSERARRITDAGILFANGRTKTGGGLFGGFVGEWLGFCLRLPGTCLLAIPLLFILGVYLVGLSPTELFQRIRYKMQLLRREHPAADRQKKEPVRRVSAPQERKNLAQPAAQPEKSGKGQDGWCEPQPLTRSDGYYDFEEDEPDVTVRIEQKSKETVSTKNPISRAAEFRKNTVASVTARDSDIVDIPDDEPEEQAPSEGAKTILRQAGQGDRGQIDTLLDDIVLENGHTGKASSYYAPFALPVRPEPKREKTDPGAGSRIVITPHDTAEVKTEAVARGTPPAPAQVSVPTAKTPLAEPCEEELGHRNERDSYSAPTSASRQEDDAVFKMSSTAGKQSVIGQSAYNRTAAPETTKPFGDTCESKESLAAVSKPVKPFADDRDEPTESVEDVKKSARPLAQETVSAKPFADVQEFQKEQKANFAFEKESASGVCSGITSFSLADEDDETDRAISHGERDTDDHSDEADDAFGARDHISDGAEFEFSVPQHASSRVEPSVVTPPAPISSRVTVVETPISPNRSKAVRPEPAAAQTVFSRTETVEDPPANRPADFSNFRLPPIGLLNESRKEQTTDFSEEIEEKKEILRETLLSFNVRLRDEIGSSRGPAITRYELRPEAGVSVRSVINHAADLSLNMAAPIRIEAPIPGKPAIGIEVPNMTRETVYMRPLLESETFRRSVKPLEVPLGLTVDGEIAMCNLAAMPHLLVAGTTGSGKSVCINTMLISLMFKTSPADLRLILIDPKQVEFAMYEHEPHLYMPIVTDMKRAVGVLSCAVQEMERRYSLIRDVGARDMDSYNELVKNDPDREHLPRMIIVIDEFADLKMGAVNNDPETLTCRLAQKARAAGMHLIVGTQRPSVDVITGKLKTNIPSRIAFTVMQQVDSRTILDVNGAETLTGKGDMLYMPIGCQKPVRVQGAFVTDGEIERVVSYVRDHNDPVHYNQAFMDQIEVEMAKSANNGRKDGEEDFGQDDSADGEDPKFLEAVELAVETQKIATSLLQRRIGVGYGRAAKIIDRMEDLGLVSVSDGNKARKVLPAAQAYLNRMAAGDDGEGTDEFDDFG